MTHHCIHCGYPIPTNDASVCICSRSPAAHVVCASCRERPPSIANQNAIWLSPLNRERLRHTAITRSAELLQQAERGERVMTYGQVCRTVFAEVAAWPECGSAVTQVAQRFCADMAVLIPDGKLEATPSAIRYWMREQRNEVLIQQAEKGNA